jgi:hypothetical protein
MIWKTTALAAAALMAMGAAPAKPTTPAKAATARPKPAAPAAKPASDASFDARDPASLIAILVAAGAKGQVARKEADGVFVTVTSTAADFSMQFAGCDAQGRKCKAVLLDSLGGDARPTPAQLNAFNQTSVMCRGYQDKASKPHVVYSTLLFPDDSKDRVRTQFAAWQGCIGDFRDFLKDPDAYLSSAP